MIVAGTGSRDVGDGGTAIYDEVFEYVINNDEIEVIISGGAEGFDHILARVAYDLSIPYHMYLPHRGYGKYYWKENSLSGKDRSEEFVHMCSNAEEIKYICKSIYVNGQHSNFIRNEAMMNAADLILCYNPTSKGTAHAYKYAKGLKKPIVLIGENLG